jgi:hypothetical protein
MATSKYTELYTAVFGQRIGKAIQCSIQVRENGVNSSLCFAHDDVETSDPNEPEPKRRRLWGKNHPELIFAPEASSSSRPDAAGCVPAGAGSIDDQPSLEQILQLADQSAPRVGKIAIQSGPLLEIIQQRYPDKTILALDICRGVDRMRKCPVPKVLHHSAESSVEDEPISKFLKTLPGSTGKFCRIDSKFATVCHPDC